LSQAVEPAPSTDAVRSLVEPARNHLKQSRFTDAEFIYTPSQIALACVKLASVTGRDLVDKYVAVKERRARVARLKSKQERQAWKQRKGKNGTAQKEVDGASNPQADADEGYQQSPLGISEDDLKTILSEVERLVEEKVKTVTEDVDLVKTIDKKLKLCQNPENSTNSRM
jgi:cyclin H